MRRTSASATSTITRPLRNFAFRSPPPPLRVPDFSAVFKSNFDACHAGKSPKTMPVPNETRRVNPSTTASSWMVAARGMFCGTAATSASVPHCAINRPSETAEAGEEQALGQKLSNDAAAACAHRGAHGNLLSANRSAREEKVRHVGIRDQEHANDCAKQNVKAGPNIADQFLAQRPGGEAHMGVLLRVLFFQRGGDGAEIGLRLFDRDTRLQTRHSLEHVIAALLGRRLATASCAIVT